MLQRTGEAAGPEAETRPAAVRIAALRPTRIAAAPPVPQASVVAAAVLLDICMIVAAALLAGTLVGLEGMPTRLHEKTVGLVTVLAVAFGVASGAYISRGFFSATRQVRAVMASAATAGFVVIGIEAVLGLSSLLNLRWLLVWATLSAMFLAAGRALLASVVLNDPDQRFAPRTVVIGGGPNSGRLVQFLRRRDERSLRLLGFVDDYAARNGTEMGALPFLGPIDEVFGLIRRGAVDQVIVALPWSAEERMLGLLHQLSEYPVHVRLAPDLISYHFPGRTVTDVGGVPLVHLMDRPISGWSHVFKRAEDIVLASIALVLLSPVLAAIALAVKLDSKGPVLFRQRRVGFNNRAFEMLKFRSMYHERSEHVIRQQAMRDDPRVTRVGAILRRLSLDELPQIVNVLRGDMSVVGPRPHAPGTRAAGRPFEDVVSRYAARHRVKPGITGLAQVRGYRGETETEDKLVRRVDSDLEYIERWSIWLDLVIIARTAFSVLRMKNAW